MTLGEYFESHYVRARFLRDSSVMAYRYAILPLRSVDLRAINADLLTDHARNQLAAGRSPHTVKSQIAMICVIWKDAERNGHAPPFVRPMGPRTPRVIIRATPVAEVVQLVHFCERLKGSIKGTSVPRAIYWPAFAAGTYETALRTSDLLQLRFLQSGRWHLIQRKTQRPVTVEVGPATLRRIQALAEVSPTLFDLGWRREWYCRGLARIARSAGIHGITPQQLRRSAASEVDRQKPGTAWIALGHSSPATTLGWYLDLDYCYRDIPRPRLPDSDP